MDSTGFASKLKDLVAQVRNSDVAQANVVVGDSIAFLKDSLVPIPDRSKTGGISQLPPFVPARDLGILRVRATLKALNTAQDCLNRSNMERALEASLGALEAWEKSID